MTAEVAEAAPPAPASATESRERPTLDQVRGTFSRLVDGLRMADGRMADEMFVLLTRQELRNIYAADRYLDELALIREAKAQSRGRR